MITRGRRSAGVVATVLMLAGSGAVEAQQGVPPESVLTLSAGAAFVVDGEFSFGFPAVSVISAGFGAKKPGSEWTLLAGRVIAFPEIGLWFSGETGFNASPGRGGTYGGVVVGYTNAYDGAPYVGARLGQRPVIGRGPRMEVRTDVVDASDGLTVFLAYFSLAYDFGRRAPQ